MKTIEKRLDQLEKRRGLLTVGSIAMMVAIAIQLSACGKDPAGPSTNCDVSDSSALAGRNLSECDLAVKNLFEADLQGANLVDALLRYAYLRDGNLEGANLTRADLEGAWVHNVNLQGANLTAANLAGANLQGAKEVPQLSAKQEEDACWSDCG